MEVLNRDRFSVKNSSKQKMGLSFPVLIMGKKTNNKTTKWTKDYSHTKVFKSMVKGPVISDFQD